MHFKTKCTYVLFVILRKTLLKKFFTPPPYEAQNFGKMIKIVF